MGYVQKNSPAADLGNAIQAGLRGCEYLNLTLYVVARV